MDVINDVYMSLHDEHSAHLNVLLRCPVCGYDYARYSIRPISRITKDGTHEIMIEFECGHEPIKIVLAEHKGQTIAAISYGVRK